MDPTTKLRSRMAANNVHVYDTVSEAGTFWSVRLFKSRALTVTQDFTSTAVLRRRGFAAGFSAS